MIHTQYKTALVGFLFGNGFLISWILVLITASLATALETIWQELGPSDCNQSEPYEPDQNLVQAAEQVAFQATQHCTQSVAHLMSSNPVHNEMIHAPAIAGVLKCFQSMEATSNSIHLIYTCGWGPLNHNVCHWTGMEKQDQCMITKIVTYCVFAQ